MLWIEQSVSEESRGRDQWIYVFPETTVPGAPKMTMAPSVASTIIYNEVSASNSQNKNEETHIILDYRSRTGH